jgi:hypothetical protein
MPHSWLLLLYKIPSEPTARRVYIWRKLKRLGALLLHDAVWVLPDTPRTREHFQWLAAEIIEMEGEAWFWEAQPALSGPEDSLVQQFIQQAEALYRAILADLEHDHADLVALGQRYQQAKQSDYFRAPSGPQVRKALTSARGGPP